MSTDATGLLPSTPQLLAPTTTETPKTGDRYNYLSLNLTGAIAKHAGKGTDLKSIAATVATVIFPILVLIASFESILFVAVNPFIWIANCISGLVATLATDAEGTSTGAEESSLETAPSEEEPKQSIQVRVAEIEQNRSPLEILFPAPLLTTVQSVSDVLPALRQEREGDYPPTPFISAPVEPPAEAPTAPKAQVTEQNTPPPVVTGSRIIFPRRKVTIPTKFSLENFSAAHGFGQAPTPAVAVQSEERSLPTAQANAQVQDPQLPGLSPAMESSDQLGGSNAPNSEQQAQPEVLGTSPSQQTSVSQPSLDALSSRPRQEREGDYSPTFISAPVEAPAEVATAQANAQVQDPQLPSLSPAMEASEPEHQAQPEVLGTSPSSQQSEQAGEGGNSPPVIIEPPAVAPTAPQGQFQLGGASLSQQLWDMGKLGAIVSVAAPNGVAIGTPVVASAVLSTAQKSKVGMKNKGPAHAMLWSGLRAPTLLASPGKDELSGVAMMEEVN